MQENTGEIKEFDREAEKRYRQEVRKALSEKLTGALKDSGFEKSSYSLWSKKVRDSWYIVYIQR